MEKRRYDMCSLCDATGCLICSLLHHILSLLSLLSSPLIKGKLCRGITTFGNSSCSIHPLSSPYSASLYRCLIHSFSTSIPQMLTREKTLAHSLSVHRNAPSYIHQSGTSATKNLPQMSILRKRLSIVMKSRYRIS